MLAGFSFLLGLLKRTQLQLSVEAFRQAYSSLVRNLQIKTKNLALHGYLKLKRQTPVLSL